MKNDNVKGRLFGEENHFIGGIMGDEYDQSHENITMKSLDPEFKVSLG
jgi:hypothetical protein